MKTVIFLGAVLGATAVSAETPRQADAHEHGVGALNIAIDGNSILMDFEAPGADIVGFEYTASTDEDKAAIEAGLMRFKSPLTLFELPAAAQCDVVDASAELVGEEHHDDHDEHGDDHDHGDHKDHDHDDHDDHGDHKDHGDAEHTEFHAEYTLECGDTSAVDQIEFGYFDVFENARQLDVQVVTGSGAQAYSVERSDAVLEF